MKLTALALRYPVTVWMGVLGIVLLGLISIFTLPIELMPESGSPTISIITRVRGGISSQDIEESVTKKVERALGDVTHLKTMQSISRESESIVILEFWHDVNMKVAALDVREKYNRLRSSLPQEVERPIIAPYNYNAQREMSIAVTSNDIDVNQVRIKVDQSIKPMFQNITGVAQVEVYGGQERKIIVDVDKYKLQAVGVSFEILMQSLGYNNLDIMAGRVERDGDFLFIRTNGELRSIKEIARIPIKHSDNGVVIRLGDVARIKDSFMDAVSYSRVNKTDGVVLSIYKKSQANTLQLEKNIIERLNKVRQQHPQFNFHVTYNQAESIRLAIQSVVKSLGWGALFVSLVLWVFFRVKVVVLVMLITIIGSILTAFFLMKLGGISINVMTLSGLALGVGLLSDSAIIIFDEILRKANHSISSLAETVGRVAPAIWGSTLTTLIVFLPLIFVNNEVRAMYGPIGLTIAFSLMAALVMALVFIPVAARQWVQLHSKKNDWPWFNWVDQQCRLYFPAVLSQAKWIVVCAGLLCLMSILFIQTRGMNLASLNESSYTVHVTPPPGAKLEVIDSFMNQLEKMLNKDVEVKTVSTEVTKTDPKIFVTLEDGVSREDSIAKVEALGQKNPEFFVYVEGSDVVQRSRELTIDVYGLDDALVQELGMQVATVLGHDPELGSIKVTNKKPRTEIRIDIDSKRAAIYGFTVHDIANVLHAKVRGMRASKFHDNGDEIEIVTRLDKEYVENFENIKNLTIINPEGERIALRQIASFYTSQQPVTVLHRDKYRTFQVTVDIKKLSLQDAAERAEQTLKNIDFPRHYFYRFGGGYHELIQGRQELTGALFVALVLIYMLLAVLFRSYVMPFFVIAAIPLGAIGVALVMLLGGLKLTNGVLMGMIMLIGLVVNNSIFMVFEINHHLNNRADLFFIDAIREGVMLRFRPIVMTTLTTVLGLIPMAIDFGASAALWRDMAWVVVGGVVVSSCTNFMLIPALFKISEPRLFCSEGKGGVL